jgi:hypothetical protein
LIGPAEMRRDLRMTLATRFVRWDAPVVRQDELERAPTTAGRHRLKPGTRDSQAEA